MGEISLPHKAKLFIGIIGVDEECIVNAESKMNQLWGEIDLQSEFIPFQLTDYYADEMGNNLLKKFCSFKQLINREKIVDIKLKTNELEESFRLNSERPGRIVNLDPGYLTLSNVSLATTKDYNHRIYITKGIFMENTLYFDRKIKSFQEWPWTYPDFRTNEYKQFFNQLRDIYHKQLKFGDEFERDF